MSEGVVNEEASNDAIPPFPNVLNLDCLMQRDSAVMVPPNEELAPSDLVSPTADVTTPVTPKKPTMSNVEPDTPCFHDEERKVRAINKAASTR